MFIMYPGCIFDIITQTNEELNIKIRDDRNMNVRNVYW